MTAIDATHAMTAASPPAATKVPWRRALVRTLLYGRNVDRAAKTRARLGLAILMFGLGYAVIAGRMIMFVTVADGHLGRRTIAQDAVAEEGSPASRGESPATRGSCQGQRGRSCRHGVR